MPDTFTDAESAIYQDCIALLSRMAALDPQIDTPLAMLLQEFAEAVSDYEHAMSQSYSGE